MSDVTAGPHGDSPSLTVRSACLCGRCGYNLIGLPMSGKCPECGTPVEDSLRGFLLRFTSVEYRGRLALGSDLVRVALALESVLVIATVIWRVPGLGSVLEFEHQQSVWTAVRFMTAILAAAGCFALTTRDSGLAMRESRWCARRVLRVAAVVLLATEVLIFAHALLILNGMMMHVIGASPGLYVTVSYAHEALFAVSTIVVLAASLRYIGWLFERLPDQARRMASRRLAWVLPVVLAVGAIVGVYGPMLVLRGRVGTTYEDWLLAQFIGSVALGTVQVAVAVVQWRLLGSVRRELEA